MEMWTILLVLLLSCAVQSRAFVVSRSRPVRTMPYHEQAFHSRSHNSCTLFQSKQEQDSEDSEALNGGKQNPYQDPQYPELEFIDYSDPNYQVDQGEDLFPEEENDDESGSITDDQLVEELREERRRKNDEYQFETYYKEIWKGGGTFKGEWTTYHTSTFLPDQSQQDESGLPLLVEDDHVLKVVSMAKKIQMFAQLEGIGPVPLTAIVHQETIASEKDLREQVGEEDLLLQENDSMGDEDSMTEDVAPVAYHMINNRYWPEELFASDFRGPSGIMCVGNAYTTCHAKPLWKNMDGLSVNADDAIVGPYAHLFTEVGMTYKRMRYRMKLEYRIKDRGQDSFPINHPPPLHLYSLTICREALGRWPRYEETDEVNVDDASTGYLFGPLGAPGGLYDPPPVGTEQQATQYMLIDLEGCASALFPYIIDQDPTAHGTDATWVTSLDWTPGRFRYQVDRKFFGGVNIRGLKTLELSEVEADQADQWRPRDGGIDMRQ